MRIFLVALSIFICMSAGYAQGAVLYMLVGTYTSGSSTGVYVYKFDSETGKSEYVSEIKALNPSYLTVSTNERYVYAVGENGSKEAAKLKPLQS